MAQSRERGTKLMHQKLTVLRATDERLRFTLVLMLWTENKQGRVQLELWGLNANIDYVFGTRLDLSAAKLCSPEVLCVREKSFFSFLR